MKQVIVVLLALILSSCSVIQCLIDHRVPPLTAIDQRFDSVQANLSQIDTFTPSVAAFISQETIKQLLAVEISGVVQKEAQKNKNLNVLAFDAKYYLSDQTIYIKPTFTLQFINERVTFDVNFSGVVGISNFSDTIYFRPALIGFDVDSIEFDGIWGGSKEALSNLAVGLLKNFRDNLNGILFKEPITLKLEWEQSFKHPLYGKSPDLSKTTFRRYEKGLTLINEDGLRLLAQITSELEDNQSEVEIDATNLGQSRSIEEFNALYSNYSEKYETLWNANFETLTETETSVLIMISKKSLSTILAETLNIQANISEEFSIPKTNFNSSIELESNKLDCQTLREPFQRRRYQRESCNWSCLRCVEVCLPVLGCSEACTDEPGCLTSRTACNVREEARVAADNATHEAERIKHQAEQEARVAACDVAREAADFTALAEFRGHSQGSGKANLQIQNVTVKPDLSSLLLRTDIEILADVQLNLKIQPIDLGYAFFCVAPYSQILNNKGRITTGVTTNEIKIIPTSNEDSLDLKFSFQAFEYEGRLNPAPLQSFITAPEFLAKCGAANILLVGTVTLSELAQIFGEDEIDIASKLLGRFSGEYTPPSFEMKIESEELALGQELKFVAVPSWKDTSIHLTSP